MKLPQALAVKANIMLNDDLMPNQYIEGLSPDELIRRVQEYAGGVIETMEVGQSLTIELTGDKFAPWKLTWKDAHNE